jgi:hypothetical protein
MGEQWDPSGLATELGGKFNANQVGDHPPRTLLCRRVTTDGHTATVYCGKREGGWPDQLYKAVAFPEPGRTVAYDLSNG